MFLQFFNPSSSLSFIFSALEDVEEQLFKTTDNHDEDTKH